MSLLSYRGQFLFIFLLEKEISFMKTQENEYILEDYKIIYSPLKENKILKTTFKDFKYVYCKDGNLPVDLLLNTIGEYSKDFDILVL